MFWPRSASWPPRAAPGGNSHQRCVRAGRRSTDGSLSGAGPRVRATLHRVIPDILGARSELDRSRCAIASFSLRAAKECKTGRGSHCRWAPRPPTCTTTRAFSRSCAASRSLLRAVLRRAVAGRPPLHRAAASALKCPSEQPRHAFAPGGNSGAISKEPFEPTCRKPGEVSQESPLSGEGRVSRATQPSCVFSHRRTSGVTGSVMSANSSCRLRNLAT